MAGRQHPGETVQSERRAERRKPKSLRDERITGKNSSPSVPRRRERSLPGEAASRGGGAASPSRSARPEPRAAGRPERRVGSRARVGCRPPTAEGPPPREVPRASPAPPGSRPAHRRAEEPLEQSHVGGQERGGRWAPRSPPARG